MYTDDVFGASNSDDSDEEGKRRKDEMGKVWEIKDVGENENFLGMRVQQDINLGTIRLTQCPYWEHVLNRFCLEHITPQNTPLPTSTNLDSNMSPKTDSEKKEMYDKPYRSILGLVMWGQLTTRPDLSFPVSLLARFQTNRLDHWKALMHVVGSGREATMYCVSRSTEDIQCSVLHHSTGPGGFPLGSLYVVGIYTPHIHCSVLDGFTGPAGGYR